MQFKDYYATLGVARDAGAEEIKKAFRRLARKYHPDVSKEANAEARMKEIIKGDFAFERREVSAAEAKKLFKGQPYKVELIEGLETKQSLTGRE